MPEYLSPGVYIEEIDAGPRPIAGVGTSTAGMVGVTVRGPTLGKPVLVTSFNEFQRQFGGFVPEPDAGLATQWGSRANPEGGRWWQFPQAVQGFFDNGGQRLFVKRVIASGATASSRPFVNGLVSTVTENAATGASEIFVDHLVGIQNTTNLVIHFRDGASPPTQSSVTVTQYRAGAQGQNRITLNVPLSRGVVAGQALVQVVESPTPPSATTLAFTAAAPGAWGDDIRLRVSPDVSTLGLLADLSEPPPLATQVAGITPVPANATSVPVRAVPLLTVGMPSFVAQIGQGTFTVSAVQAVTGTTDTLQLTLQGTPQHPGWQPGTAVRRVRRANTSAGPTLRVAGASRLYPGAIVELDNGTAKQTLEVQQVDGENVIFTSNASPGYLDNHRLHLFELQVQVSYTDERGTVTDERFGAIRLTQGDDQAAERRINDESDLVTVAQQLDMATAPLRLPIPTNLADGLWVSLGGGLDGYDSLRPSDFVGIDGGSGRRSGIQALEDVDEVAICAVPGMWSGIIHSNLIQHCELLKDRFAVLDPPDGLDTQQIQDFRSSYDTRYAALYYPWLVTRDPLSDRDVNIPPSGHMIGIYARVDVERGVHKAPANVPIRGIRTRPPGISLDVTKRHQDLLNPRGINALRAFPNRGSRVWGARTLSSDTTWQYINVRRLFIYLEESIEEGTQWVVFEPNDEALWALVRQTVSNFLNTEWRNGRLRGLTPDEAFFVRCDATTMTETDIANGRLICLIGVAPVFPAEFVIFRIQQKTRELQPA